MVDIEHGWDGKVPQRALTRKTFYQPNYASMAAFMVSEQIRGPVAEVARDIAKMAGALSPATQGSPDGPLALSFKVDREAGVIKVDKALRVKVEVYSNDRSAAPNEFGSQRNKRHRMLGRAGAAFGDFKGDL